MQKEYYNPMFQSPAAPIKVVRGNSGVGVVSTGSAKTEHNSAIQIFQHEALKYSG